MNIEKKDIINLWNSGEWVCVTINQYVSPHRVAVMGRGNALAMSNHMPRLAANLGKALSSPKRKPDQILVASNARLIAFPVKPSSVIAANDLSNVVKHKRADYKPGSNVPGWAAVADVDIITTAYASLHEWVKKTGTKVYLPIPGCGAGELSWEHDVKPIAECYESPLIQHISKP